jgi:hypothetical protein
VSVPAVILCERSDIGNDVYQAETLSKLIDRCGIERCAGDEGDLVIGDGAGIHGAEKQAAAVEHHSAKAIV